MSNIPPFLRCPNCGSEDIMKNGTTRRGKQNYKCRDCGRQFVENPQWKRRAKDEPLKRPLSVKQISRHYS